MRESGTSPAEVDYHVLGKARENQTWSKEKKKEKQWYRSRFFLEIGILMTTYLPLP